MGKRKIQKSGPIQVLQKSHRFGEKSGIGALARAVNAGDARKSMGLFQKDGGERTDIKRMVLESLEVKAFQRLVFDGLGSSAVVPDDESPHFNSMKGRADDKAHFIDKSEAYKKRGIPGLSGSGGRISLKKGCGY